ISPSATSAMASTTAFCVLDCTVIIHLINFYILLIKPSAKIHLILVALLGHSIAALHKGLVAR
ncbi:MAG TPA: hypothetical protein PKE57_04925, partial [Cellvibrionaceae bacterium]|nr:hypothetical protein [Cellvibrionaceae bacterium]